MTSFLYSSEEFQAVLDQVALEDNIFTVAEEEGMTPGLEAFALDNGVDLSEEGLVNWVSDKIQAVIHKFQIFANEAWAKLTNANQETREAIRRAEQIGFDHNEKLPVGKGMSLLISAGAAVAAVGACVLASKAISSGRDKVKQTMRDARARQLRRERSDRDAASIARGKRWIDNTLNKAAGQRAAELKKLEEKARRGEVTLSEVDSFKNKVNSELKSELSRLEQNLKSSKTMNTEVAAHLSAARRQIGKAVTHTKAEHLIFDTYGKWRGVVQGYRNHKAGAIKGRRALSEKRKRFTGLFKQMPGKTSSGLIHN